METYPQKLLPQPGFPILENAEVADGAFVRETNRDLYAVLEKKGYEKQDILPFIVAPQPSLREVFELSVFLYGYYDEDCAGIRVEDQSFNAEWAGEMPPSNIRFFRQKVYPLFLTVAKWMCLKNLENGQRKIWRGSSVKSSI